MANEIVKYDNSFNQLILRNFTPTEMNILFAIISRVRDKKDHDVVLSEDYLKKITQYQHNGDFSTYILSTYDKIGSIHASTTNGPVVSRFTLFTNFEYNKETRSLRVSVNPEHINYFNELTQWTRFSLNEFTGLSSNYSKTMMRLLKQYRTQGVRKFTLEEFRERLSIPPSYRSSDINKRVLKLIKEELSPIFKGLEIVKLKHGRKIVGYSFTWHPEANNRDDFSKVTSIDDAIQNILLNDFLSDEEKWLAQDRVLGLPFGTTKAENEKQRAQAAKPIKAIEKEEPDASIKEKSQDTNTDADNNDLEKVIEFWNRKYWQIEQPVFNRLNSLVSRFGSGKVIEQLQRYETIKDSLPADKIIDAIENLLNQLNS